MIEEAADHEEIEDGEAVLTPGDKIDFLFFWTLMAPYPVGCSQVANHIYMYVKEGVPKHLRTFKFKEDINWKKIQWWDSTVIYCAYLSKVSSKIFLHSLGIPHMKPGHTVYQVISTYLALLLGQHPLMQLAEELKPGNCSLLRSGQFMAWPCIALWLWPCWICQNTTHNILLAYWVPFPSQP